MILGESFNCFQFRFFNIKNQKVNKSVQFLRSFMHIKNKIGPKIKPCGTYKAICLSMCATLNPQLSNNFKLEKPALSYQQTFFLVDMLNKAFIQNSCSWEELGSTPVLHVGWTKSIIKFITMFDHSIRIKVKFVPANINEGTPRR